MEISGEARLVLTGQLLNNNGTVRGRIESRRQTSAPFLFEQSANTTHARSSTEPGDSLGLAILYRHNDANVPFDRVILQ